MDERQKRKERERYAKRKLLRTLDEMRAARDSSPCLEAGDEGQAAVVCEEDSNTGWTQAELQKAAQMVGRAKLWVRDNPGPWAWMLKESQAAVAAKRPVSAHRMLYEVREMQMVDSSGKPSRPSNCHASTIARLLIEAVPGLEKYMRTNRTPVDAVIGGGIVEGR